MALADELAEFKATNLGRQFFLPAVFACGTQDRTFHFASRRASG
jgi:hypothetical protein